MAVVTSTFTFQCVSVAEYAAFWAELITDIARGIDGNGNVLSNVRRHGSAAANSLRVDYRNDDFTGLVLPV